MWFAPQNRKLSNDHGPSGCAPQNRKWKWSNNHGLLETNLSNSVSQYSPAPVVNIVPMLGRLWSNLNLPKNALTIRWKWRTRDKMRENSHRMSTYQKQKTAMMATRIGFFTFFKLGWSNNVDSTPWRNGFDVGSRLVHHWYHHHHHHHHHHTPPWSQSESQGRVRGACRRKGKTRWGHQGS